MSNDEIETDIGDFDESSSGGWGATNEPTAAITDAVAVETNRAANELPPLNEYVEADALNALLCRDGFDTDVQVSFTYEQIRVTVDSSGYLFVQTRE
ncbi:HalOD1 output domain-containing protein [Haloarcula amylovorans]|uniref:HalOD1 output domain-containing protein n=1 Tax=Haloarcula amylovorans TaxID=2562280 RepID=UPI001075D424|nr:HalOD1 output domain-containing protein [Halomicroarcula amylolytica]